MFVATKLEGGRGKAWVARALKKGLFCGFHNSRPRVQNKIPSTYQIIQKITIFFFWALCLVNSTVEVLQLKFAAAAWRNINTPFSKRILQSFNPFPCQDNLVMYYTSIKNMYYLYDQEVVNQFYSNLLLIILYYLW